MGWLKSIFKRKVTKVTYIVKCENIVKKPCKDEVLLIKFPEDTSQFAIKKFRDIISTALKEKYSVILFNKGEVLCGKVKIKEDRKCKRTK